jgi:hypothetical protein
VKSPNFFLIGAPKCGTTSLAAWLSEHPQIYMPAIKEPHFFNTDGLQSITSKTDYKELFRDAKAEHIAVGEASTHYLFSQAAVPNILGFNPDAKFIVCFRNPVEAAPSLHSERLYNGRENIKDFISAWKIQENRRAGRNIPSNVISDPERLQYGSYCLFGAQLQRLYQAVNSKSVKVVLLDDIRTEPARVYSEILDFLGVPNTYTPQFQKLNSYKHVRSVFVSVFLRRINNLKERLGIKTNFGFMGKLASINVVHGQKLTLDEEFRRELILYFEQDIRLLMNLIQRDLTKWLK